MKPGDYFFVKGCGVCRFARVVGATLVVSPYSLSEDDYLGNVYIDPSDLTRPATEVERKQYEANVKAAFTPRVATEQHCTICNTTSVTRQPHCPKCGADWSRSRS